jgi:hypothetical protein
LSKKAKIEPKAKFLKMTSVEASETQVDALRALEIEADAIA